MMESTQEEIQKTVSSLFDITDSEISLTKIKSVSYTHLTLPTSDLV